MKLYVISNQENLPNEHVLITSLFREGLQRFHLRKPSLSDNDMRSFLMQIPQEYIGKIVIHTHHYLAKEFGLYGTHLTEQARKTTPSVRRITSTSFHTLEEVASCTIRYEYAFLSPVFGSFSKPGYTGKLSMEEIKKFLKKSESKEKLVALGGIDETNVEILMKAGFKGAALSGSIWKSTHPANKFKAIWKLCQSSGQLS